MFSLLKKLFYGACCLGLLATRLAFAADLPFDQLVVFGDSLSDSGNLYQLSQVQHFSDPTKNKISPGKNYDRGHFSNGDTWIEILSAQTSLPLADFAYGGAWAEPANYSGDDQTPDLNKQIQQYLDLYKNDQHKDQHLYFIWAGANDYLHSLFSEPNADFITTRVQTQIDAAATTLIKNGAKHIIILGLPRLGDTPLGSINALFSKTLNNMSDMHNQKILNLVTYIKNKTNQDIRFFDIASPLTDILNNPGNYNIKVINEGCVNYATSMTTNTMKTGFSKNPILSLADNVSHQVKLPEGCAKDKADQNPDDYAFWDGLHPTRVLHQIIEQKILDEIQKPLK